LVDTYLLGIKDCFGQVLTQGEDKKRLEDYRERDVRKIDPPSAKRLIEDALTYAKSFGFSPHNDYPRVKPIWNGIDSSRAQESFEMGKDGKPFFFAGPHDSPAECRRIVDILERKCGPEGYHVTMPIAPGGVEIRAITSDGQDE